jgi:hypothetical protein
MRHHLTRPLFCIVTLQEGRHAKEVKDFQRKLFTCSDETHQAKYEAKVDENKAQREYLTEKADLKIEHAKCRNDAEAYETLLNRFELANTDILCE